MSECPVCLDPCDEEKDTVTRCCKKVYHESCFNKCIQLHGRCPTCRNMYTLVEVRPSGIAWKTVCELCCAALVVVTICSMFVVFIVISGRRS